MKRVYLVLLSAACFYAAAGSSPLAAQDKEKKATVMVIDRLPLRVTWTQGDKSVDVADGEDLPVGEVTLRASAHHIGEYKTVVVKFSLNGKALGVTDREVKLKLADGDRVGVALVDVDPPSNATKIQFKGHAMIVSLMYAWAVSNEDVGFDATKGEKYRSTSMLIAHYGVMAGAKRDDPYAVYEKGCRKVADNLAAFVHENLASSSDTRGRFRNKEQIAVLFETDVKGGVVSAQASAPEKELADAIYQSLLVQKRRLMVKPGETASTTFFEEVERAAKLVKVE